MQRRDDLQIRIVIAQALGRVFDLAVEPMELVRRTVGQLTSCPGCGLCPPAWVWTEEPGQGARSWRSIACRTCELDIAEDVEKAATSLRAASRLRD